MVKFSQDRGVSPNGVKEPLIDEKFVVGEEESTDEPHELCMVCLMTAGAEKAAKHLRCGHLYHEDCVAFFTKYRIDCPLCYYISCNFSLDLEESASKTEIKKPAQPGETCFACQAEFGSEEPAAGCMGCGKVYHVDCMEYYTKHNIGCPACHYTIVESVKKLASEGDRVIEDDSPTNPSELCPMCLVELGPKDTVKYLCCGHVYHQHCYPAGDQHGTQCSVCRRDVLLNKIFCNKVWRLSDL